MTNTDSLLTSFNTVRCATTALAEPLSPEDCCVQSMPDASPVKWHLAHTTWFFETFILELFEKNFSPVHPSFRMLFNSYYNGIGDKYPRPQRGLITRPTLAEVKGYRNAVDDRIAVLLRGAANGPQEQAEKLVRLIALGMQHEQQHQELMLTDIKHLLSHNPLHPAYAAATPSAIPDDVPPLRWYSFDGGLIEVGHAGSGFCFDNELPRHRQFVEPFALASRLVTNKEYCAFIDAGGYRDPGLWLSEGWEWLHAHAAPITHPLYWEQRDGEWHEFTLRGLQALDGRSAAMHLSYFEADAYARWANARLPTEAEWEHAVSLQCGQKNGTPILAKAPFVQLFDTAWQWTASSYAPYPGYQVPSGAIGEYNGKFMVNQYVLRGASSATPAGHSRVTYRNFFPSHARWQFTSIRLARST
ncbi:MAG TPA: ergothioneine biosynthesis protein EgtB [Eoetvoesiella sp.]